MFFFFFSFSFFFVGFPFEFDDNKKEVYLFKKEAFLFLFPSLSLTHSQFSTKKKVPNICFSDFDSFTYQIECFQIQLIVC